MRYRAPDYDPQTNHLAHPELVPEYAEPCGVCEGSGEYPQTYTAGCGMGTYRHRGPCDYCRETGLLYRGTLKPPPDSVLEQIKVAVKNKEAT